MLAGSPQPRTEDFHQAYRDVGLTAQQREQVAPLDDEQAAIRVRDRVGGARLSVEQRDLAENLALANEVEDRVLAVRRRRRDLHDPLANRKQTSSRIAFGKDDRLAFNAAGRRIGAKMSANIGSELPKQRVPVQ